MVMVRIVTHFLKRARIKENPAKLDNLCRVLCHINAVLIAGGCHMDHHIAIDVELRKLLRSHICVTSRMANGEGRNRRWILTRCSGGGSGRNIRSCN